MSTVPLHLQQISDCVTCQPGRVANFPLYFVHRNVVLLFNVLYTCILCILGSTLYMIIIHKTEEINCTVQK